MKMAMFWTIVLFPIFLSSTDFSSNDVFHEGSLLTIKHKAGTEGKLYFLDFYADWCASCQLMEETTFKDPSIVSMIKNNYVGTKVNIENFDGIALKQLHDIYILPTILIFNSKGELVERIEKALQPSEFMPILEMHNTDYNKEVIYQEPLPVENVVSVGNVNDTPAFENETNDYKYTDTEISIEELNVQKNYVPRQDTKVYKVNNEKSFVTANNFFQLDINTYSKEGYSVKMGVFESYSDLIDYATEIEQKVVSEKFINVRQENGSVTFELYFGLFEYKYGAEDFNEIVGLDFSKGMVIDLSILN